MQNSIQKGYYIIGTLLLIVGVVLSINGSKYGTLLLVVGSMPRIVEAIKNAQFKQIKQWNNFEWFRIILSFLFALTLISFLFTSFYSYSIILFILLAAIFFITDFFVKD